MFDLTRFDLRLFEESAGRAATLLRLLANEKRLMILCQLADGEMAVGEIQSHVNLSQSALSQHLALLRTEGIVATRREGQAVFYRLGHLDLLADAGVARQLQDWMQDH